MQDATNCVKRSAWQSPWQRRCTPYATTKPCCARAVFCMPPFLVARGEAGEHSDVDILVELEPHKPCGVYEFVRLQLDLGQLFGGRIELAERAALKPLIREWALRDAVQAF